MAHRPKPVRLLIKDRPVLSRLEQEADAQLALLHLVRRHLPEELAPHCVGARLHAHRLVLHTDSPVWASRLRYLAKQLQSLLERHHPELREIKIRLIMPDSGPPKRQSVARRSDRAAAIIQDCATDTRAGPLKTALSRLSRALKTDESDS